MKKLLLLLSALALTFGCYDDSDIRSELREHEARLTTLETLCQQANSNIEALQTAVSALQKNVYVSAIIPVKKNGEVIGYAISFTNAETITIYHGQDGDKGEQGEKGNDGATPAVGLKRYADGIYYWTLNGEWLLDDSGKKVPASGKDGADGLPGASGPQGAAGKDGVTPHLKIEEGYWYVSYDGGKTWEDEPLGQATGDKGYTMFEMVEYDEEYLYITMADGEKLTLPRMDHGHGGVGPLIWSVDAITAVSATITGSLSVPVDDLAFSKVTVCYSDGENFNVYDAKKVSTTTFDADQKFSISITGLNPNVRYNYCLIVKVKSEEIYGKLESFTTLHGDLAVVFGADDLSVEAGGTIPVPFSILGSEGVALNIEVTTSDPEVQTYLKYDATYTGVIEFTAPIAVASNRDVTVTIKVSDEYGRNAENSTTVTMLASEPLALALTDNIKSVATTAGGSFTLPVVLTGKGNATVPENVTISASNGWSASFAWNADKTGGTITVTAPAALTDNVTVKMSFKDSYDREASIEIPLSISTISIAENAANCHIAAPGSTITIKAVKGNSTQELDFNNASLVWQDQMGLVKSVAGNGSAKAIVVELNAGKTGNAVVAAKKDGVIVWSWHVWVTDYDPTEAPMVYTGANGTYTFMDRNLGASTNEKYTAGSFGLFYQWGRKDPFVGADGVESNVYVKKYDMEGNQVREVNQLRPVYEDFTTTNLDLSIQNPTVFYYAPSSAWPVVDWLTDDAQLQDNDLWGGVSGHKSIYDPCPEGWMVPPAGDCWGFRKQYRKEGALNDAKPYDPTYAWYIEYEMQYCIGFRYRDTAGKEFWFPFAGKKDGLKGDLNGVAGGTQYHTRNNSNTTVLCEILAWSNPASETGLNRTYGNLIRCIKED